MLCAYFTSVPYREYIVVFILRKYWIQVMSYFASERVKQLQGYPQRMRLQRPLFGIYLFHFLSVHIVNQYWIISMQNHFVTQQNTDIMQKQKILWEKGQNLCRLLSCLIRLLHYHHFCVPYNTTHGNVHVVFVCVLLVFKIK